MQAGLRLLRLGLASQPFRFLCRRSFMPPGGESSGETRLAYVPFPGDWALSGASLSAQWEFSLKQRKWELKNLPAIQETWVRSLSRKDSPGEGNGNPPQYSCLKNPMDREAWKTTGHKESDMAEVTHTQGLSESPLFKANKHRKQINSNPLRMVI